MRLMYFLFICMLLSNKVMSRDVDEFNSLSKLKGFIPGVCDGITDADKYFGMSDCISRISMESDKLVVKRLLEYRKKLKLLGNSETAKEYRVEFEKWHLLREKTKKQRCKYESLGPIKDSSAYYYITGLCNITENYDYLDSIKFDPSIP